MQSIIMSQLSEISALRIDNPFMSLIYHDSSGVAYLIENLIPEKAQKVLSHSYTNQLNKHKHKINLKINDDEYILYSNHHYQTNKEYDASTEEKPFLPLYIKVDNHIFQCAEMINKYFGVTDTGFKIADRLFAREDIGQMCILYAINVEFIVWARLEKNGIFNFNNMIE